MCIIDDDRLITDISDLEFGFSVWQVFDIISTINTMYKLLVFVFFVTEV